MRLSRLFTKTSKDVPADETSKNAQLLMRAGFVNKTMAGVYAMLPLGLRVINNIENIVRRNMNQIGGQEIKMNSLHPKDSWIQTKRWDTVDVLFKIQSQTGNEYALAPTHEEQVTPIIKQYIDSWKDLPEYEKDSEEFPLAVYQIQTKFRDEKRSKAGLMRGREFRMKDLYDFHQTESSQDAYYEVVKSSYVKLYNEMGLEANVVQASGGVFSKYSHEFQVICEAGEDKTVIWEDNLKENLEISQGYLQNLKAGLSDLKFMIYNVEVETEEQNITKNYLFGFITHSSLEFNEELFFDLITNTRGFRSYPSIKLSNVKSILTSDFTDLDKTSANINNLKVSIEKEMKSTTPLNILYWILDKSLENISIEGLGSIIAEYKNIDHSYAFEYACISEIQEGFVRLDSDPLVRVKEIVKSAEVGNIFKLGKKWTEAFDLKYNNKLNAAEVPFMSCHGIGTSRCMGVIAEMHSDDKGLKWPKSVAPFLYHLVTNFNSKDEPEIQAKIEELAKQIYSGNLVLNVNSDAMTLDTCPNPNSDNVLWDDRKDANMGNKLADAELIGCPYILIVSKRNLENSNIEVKIRETGESVMIVI